MAFGTSFKQPTFSPHPIGSTPINPSSVGTFSGGSQYAQPTGRNPMAGLSGGSPFGGVTSPLLAILQRRLGASQGGSPAGPGAMQEQDTGAPTAAQPTGWAGLGGVGDFINDHRNAIGDLGKVAGGAFGAYDAYETHKAERDEMKRQREDADRKRQQEADNVQALGPVYQAILARLGHQLGAGA